MESEPFTDICHAIYQQIWSKLERARDERSRFATRGTAAKVLNDDNLRRVFRSLVSPQASAEEQLGIGENEFVARVRERKVHDFLAILIFATCGISAAKMFVRKLVAVDDPWAPGPDRKLRGSLPADHYEIEELFENVVDTDKFLATQACFCTVVLRKGEEVRVESLDRQRTPYLDEAPLAEGSFGKVYKVKIAKGHFYDRSVPGFKYNSEEMWVARKDYIISGEFHATREREIMEKINTSAGTCKNIVENLGSLAIGTTTYSLFMPCAICDLSEYMLRYNQVKPETLHAKADIIRCAKGLANGLNFLHSGIETEDTEELVCYHMDLKPSNVLVFSEWADEPMAEERAEGLTVPEPRTRERKIRLIWKLSDFGMACVKIRRHGEGADSERDFNRLFKMRKTTAESNPAPSLTLPRRGEGTYLAPESLSSERTMGTESDVWSLGCVLSIVFAYLEEGADGVVNYEDARANYRTADDYDRFFVRNRFRKIQVNPVIKEWHDGLVDKAMRRSHQESEIVKDALEYLENWVFKVEASRRCSAGSIMKVLNKALDRYLKMAKEEGDAAPRRGSHATLPALTMNKSLWQLWTDRKTKKQTAGQKVSVEQWHLHSEDSFKGCVISPDTKLVAYWSDTKIVLYSTPKEKHNTIPADERELKRTDCVWKSVDVAGKYLVACTAGRNYCYIFNLEKGRSVDVVLGHFCIVVLPVSGIHKVAISPGGKKLVCVVWEGDPKAPSSLVYGEISDLEKWAKERYSGPQVSSANPGRNSPDPSENGNAQSPWSDKVALQWSAGEITCLSVTDTGVVHLVVRPELTARSLEHKIPIVRISIGDETIDTLNIESRGFDSSGPVGFFTTFCPFPNEGRAACATVTREKRVQILTFPGVQTPLHIDREIANYRILKLMMGRRDESLFALGCTSAKHKILLLELKVPQSGDVSVTELAQLPGLSYGDDLVGMMSDDNDEKYFLIATPLGKNQRLVYGVSLGVEG